MAGFLFIQSPALSLYNHFSLKAFTDIPRNLDMRVISFAVYVGDMVLQQFAQSRQSVLAQESSLASKVMR